MIFSRMRLLVLLLVIVVAASSAHASKLSRLERQLAATREQERRDVQRAEHRDEKAARRALKHEQVEDHKMDLAVHLQTHDNVKALSGDDDEAFAAATPSVSIMMPTSAAREWFAMQAVNTLDEQTMRGYELIVVDENHPSACVGSHAYRAHAEALLAARNATLDAARDEEATTKFGVSVKRAAATLGIEVRQYAVHAHVRYVCVHGSPSIGLKRSLAALVSRSAVVAFWDDDDLYERDRLRRQLDYMYEQHADIVALPFDYVLDAREAPVQLYVTRELEHDGTVAAPFAHYGTIMFRRDLVDDAEHLFDDASFGEDFGFVARAQERGAKFAVMPRQTVRWMYVRHQSSTWQTFDIDRAVKRGDLEALGASGIPHMHHDWPEWLRRHAMTVAEHLHVRGELAAKKLGARRFAAVDRTLVQRQAQFNGSAQDTYEHFSYYYAVAPPPPPPECLPFSDLKLSDIPAAGTVLSNGIIVNIKNITVGGVEFGDLHLTRGVSNSGKEFTALNLAPRPPFENNDQEWTHFAGIVVSFSEPVLIFNYANGDYDGPETTIREQSSVQAWNRGVPNNVQMRPTIVNTDLVRDVSLRPTPEAQAEIEKFLIDKPTFNRAAPLMVRNTLTSGDVEPDAVSNRAEVDFGGPLTEFINIAGVRGGLSPQQRVISLLDADIQLTACPDGTVPPDVSPPPTPPPPSP